MIGVLTPGLGAGGERAFPRRVAGFGVNGHAGRVDGGRLQTAHRERVAGHVLSGYLDPHAATVVTPGLILARERQYRAHLSRPRTERERGTGRVHRQHRILVGFFGYCQHDTTSLLG